MKVNGVVTLDGNPVEGATVSFVSQDGNTYTGFTDAQGNFSLSSGSAVGALPGEYKVTVVKTPALKAGEAMAAPGADYLKQMENEAKEGAKNAKAGKMAPMTGMMPGGAKGPMKGPPGMTPGGTAAKSELPPIYASATSTPLTVKIPPDTQPVRLELKSK